MNTKPETVAISTLEAQTGEASPLPEMSSEQDEPGGCRPAGEAGLTSPSAKPANPAFWMLCGAFSFSVMGAIANALGSRCDWRLVAQTRTIFSFLAALTLARLAGVPLVYFRPRILWLRSIAGTFSLMTTFFALSQLPLADTLTLTNTYPLWIVLIGYLVWGEKVEFSIIVAVTSAVAGVALIQRPHMAGNSLALAAALSAAVFTSVAMMGLNRLGAIDPRAVVTHFSGVAALIMVPVIALGHPVQWKALSDPVTLLMLLGVGVTGTIGQIFLTKAYAVGSAPKVAVVGMSQVAMGLLFDIIYRQALPPVLTLAGMALVIGPVVWVILQGKGRPKRSARESANSPSPRGLAVARPKPVSTSSH